MSDTELIMERLRELGQRLGYVELVLTQGHPPPDTLSQRVAEMEIGLRELEWEIRKLDMKCDGVGKPLEY